MKVIHTISIWLSLLCAASSWCLYETITMADKV